MQAHLPPDIQRLIAAVNQCRDLLEDPDVDLDDRGSLIRRLVDIETRLDRLHLDRLADPYHPDHPRRFDQLDAEITALLEQCTPTPAPPPGVRPVRQGPVGSRPDEKVD